MDISETLVAKSDQLNASDLSGGPITVTVESVDVLKGNDQPVHVHLVGMKGRPYKPSKGMRRVIAEAWGPDSSAWVGRSMTLYRNPEVKYAGVKMGGIEVSAMTHLEKPMTTSVRENQKVARPHTVKPLKVEAPPAPIDWAAQIEGTGGDVEALRRLWQDASKAGANEDTLNRIAQAAQEATRE